MSDFEKRLGEALSAGSQGAPGSTVGLAAGARRRSRARRLTTIAGVAAAVALAVAVPVGIVGLGGSHSDAPVADRVTDPNVGPVADTKTTRTETWRNVTLEVPADWEYGGVTVWCADGRDRDAPVVQRPGIAVPAIGCSPSRGYGVTLGSVAPKDQNVPAGTAVQVDDDQLPEEAWLGYSAGGVDDAGLQIVEVVAPDQATAQAVLDSVTRVADDDRDPNGCLVRYRGLDDGTDSEQMSVCRYTPDGWLEQSERLSEAGTAKAVTALNTAPDGDAPLPLSFCPVEPGNPGTVITMRSSDYVAEVVLDKPCTLNTSFRSEADGYRKLTRDVMFWALSPGWSGSLASGVPTPRPLRQLVAPEQDPIADDLQTVEYDGIVVEVPQDWTPFDGEDCEFPVVRAGPPGRDPCDPQTAPLSFYGEANFDASTAPGELVSGDDSSLVSGYVIAGSYAVYLKETDRELALRILASARRVDEAAVDSSTGWRTESFRGLSVEVPGTWVDGRGVGCGKNPPAGSGLVVRPGEPVPECGPGREYLLSFATRPPTGLGGGALRKSPDGRWTASSRGSDTATRVDVVAPTQAIAQLILASVVAE